MTLSAMSRTNDAANTADVAFRHLMDLCTGSNPKWMPQARRRHSIEMVRAS